MSYTYATYKTALAALIEIDEDNTDFTAILPTVISYAEDRCYGALDLMAARVTTSGTLTANNRSFTLPTTNGHVLEVDYINVLDASSVRHLVTPAQRDVIDMLWPSNTSPSASTIPNDFARINDTTVLLGPSPGNNWSCEVIHTIRPSALSVTNTTTFLSQYLPALFMVASMIFYSGYSKNYGAQSDDPRQAQSWESQFKELLQLAVAEELRKKYIIEMSS